MRTAQAVENVTVMFVTDIQQQITSSNCKIQSDVVEAFFSVAEARQ